MNADSNFGHQCFCCICPGTALAINMPMTVEAVVAYLGIVLAGCAVVSIADSFAAVEVAARLKIAKAAAIFTQVRQGAGWGGGGKGGTGRKGGVRGSGREKEGSQQVKDG